MQKYSRERATIWMIKCMGIPLKIAMFFIKFYTKIQNLNTDQLCHSNPEAPMTTRSKCFYLTSAQWFCYQQISWEKNSALQQSAVKEAVVKFTWNALLRGKKPLPSSVVTFNLKALPQRFHTLKARGEVVWTASFTANLANSWTDCRASDHYLKRESFPHPAICKVFLPNTEAFTRT